VVAQQPLSGVVRQPAPTLGPRAQRSVASIIDAAREVFLRCGYAGTTIDEIGRAANVSRASFYTYFSSKRDVLLAVGARSAGDTVVVIDRLGDLGGTRVGMQMWVEMFMDHLEVNGSFAFAWTQAAREDPEILSGGMKRHLALCRHFGEVLAGTAGRTTPDPVALGICMFSSLERAWSYCSLYGDAVDQESVRAQLATALWATARHPATSSSGGGR